jgi:hypothetical protein
MLLPKELQQQLNEACKAGGDRYKLKDYEGALSHFFRTWEILPEPKEVYDESYHIVKYIFIIAMAAKNCLTASEWIPKIYNCDKERIDSGEREYLHGQLAYSLNEMNKAKRYPTEKEYKKLMNE